LKKHQDCNISGETPAREHPLNHSWRHHSMRTFCSQPESICILMMFLCFCMLTANLGSRAADENPFVFIAGYDNTVYCFEFNSATGEMKELSRSDCGKNPTYMAIHPSRKYMYAANENKEGMASSYSIDPKDGKLTKLNEVSAGGD